MTYHTYGKKNTNYMTDVVKNDKDSLMRASYHTITLNFTKTINRFIVFKDGTNIIEIPHGIGQRGQFIDILIKYFETLEEYEKCKILIDLKELVIETGN